MSAGDAEISRLKTMGEQAGIEAMIASRDATINRHQAEYLTIQAELADAQKARDLAEEMVTASFSRNQDLEAQVGTLREENFASHNQLGLVGSSNATLRREIERMQAELAELGRTKGVLTNRLTLADEEIDALKDQNGERESRIDNLVESLSRTANDAQVLREEVTGLQHCVATYEAEARTRRLVQEDLESRMQEREGDVSRLRKELEFSEVSLRELSERLSESESALASTSLELEQARGNVGSLESKSADAMIRLRAEEDKTLQLTRDLAERNAEVQLAKELAIEAQSVVDELKAELSLQATTSKRQKEDLSHIRERLQQSEAALIEAQGGYEVERAATASEISQLQALLVSSKTDHDRVQAQLVEAQKDRVLLTENMSKKEGDLAALQFKFDEVQQTKMAIEADLVTYVGKTQQLEEALRNYEALKADDQAALSKLRHSFKGFQEAQLQIFGDLDHAVSI